MELRETWHIVRRRWWLPLGLAILAAASSLSVTARASERWQGTVSLAISLPGQPATPTLFTYNDYYTWVTSEYLIDDLTQIMKGQRFARDVLAEAGESTTGDVVMRGQKAEKTHRVLSFSVETADPEQASRLAGAAARVIQTKGGDYLAQLHQKNAVLTVVDGPAVAPVRPVTRSALDAGVRGALGLILGLGALFLIEYLDPTIRSSRELERLLRVPVMGEIPQEG